MQTSPRSIVLIGMMGAGKSAVGRALQQKTGLQLCDLDEMIVKRAGASIPEIFAHGGEEHFRKLETSALSEVHVDRPAIIVTGGGIVLNPANVVMLQEMGTVVWLDAAPETLFARASRRGNRPLLQGENPRERLEQLLKTRRPLYGAAAQIRIDTTNHSCDEIADIVLRELQIEAMGARKN